MKNLFRIFLIAGMGLTLAACAGMQLQKARDTKAGGDAFEKALYAGYLGLSQSEFSEGDYMDSDVFADRAMVAAGGNKVGPEAMKARVLPSDMVGPMTYGRKRLTSALDNGARTKVPALAAKAQVGFDCWMQEQEENFQPKDIAACRKVFLAAMGQVESALEPPKMVKKAKPTMVRPEKPTVDGVYVLFFDFDSEQLNPAGKEVVRKAIFDYHLSKAGGVSLSGHADTSGTNAYNQALSARRLATVKAALENGNIPASKASFEAFGENKLLVQTGDGKKEPKNRRVEIVLD